MTTTISRRALLASGLSGVVSALGCATQFQHDRDTFLPPEHDFVLTVLLDMSGSYEGLMAKDGRAYKLLIRLVDNYFRHNIGNQSKIVVGQLSGNEQSMLWEGTPRELRRRFSDPDEFAAFLKENAQPDASRIHDGIADAIEYELTRQERAKSQIHSAIIVFSDMEDNCGDNESVERLLAALQAYGRQAGSIGLYWVDHSNVATWRKHLRQCGFSSYVVESEIVANPPLPEFH